MLARGKTRIVQLAVSPLMWYLSVSSEIRGAKLYQKICVRINAPRNAPSTTHRLCGRHSACGGLSGRPADSSDTLCPPPDRNQQTSTHSDRALMPRPETVLVARFDIPTESTLRGRPEHKIQHHFTAQ